MSSENAWLLAFAAALFTLNALLGGPIAAGIASFFARFLSSKGSDGATAASEAGRQNSKPAPRAARAYPFVPPARVEPGPTDPRAVQDQARPRPSQLGRSVIGP